MTALEAQMYKVCSQKLVCITWIQNSMMLLEMLEENQFVYFSQSVITKKDEEQQDFTWLPAMLLSVQVALYKWLFFLTRVINTLLVLLQTEAPPQNTVF